MFDALHAPPGIERHSTAVAEVAAFLAQRTELRGIRVDRRLVESAALLHDMDKTLPKDDPLRQLGHGHAGARWLVEHGCAELAPAVANHPVNRLGQDSHRDLSAYPTREERIVAYADKRAALRLESMNARFARWLAKHPDNRDSLQLAQQRAAGLERDVCKAAGIEPREVRRLRWVSRARRSA